MSSLTYLDKKLEHIGWTNKHYYIFVSCSGAVLIDMLWLANMTIIFQWLAGDWGISES